MGKKVMGLLASVKISKQNSHYNGSDCKKKQQQQQLNNLIEALRPKVYISDCSDFKRLVQELTGNGSIAMPFPAPSSPERTTEAVVLENTIPVIDISEDHEDRLASMEACSFDASDDSLEFCHDIISSTEGSGETDTNLMMHLNDAMLDMSSMNQLGEDWLTCQELESWLLDVDQPCPAFNNFGQYQEVSIYDYELSGLL